MFDKFFVGGDVMSSSDNGKYKPVSRVTLMLDDDNAITAGDDTGREIVANCPHATQDMVNALLASMKGHEYQAYEADSANIDPSAELGDGVTVGGIYSVIATIRDDGSGYASISAPGESELEDEYPMDGPITQMFNRKLAKTRSVISKRVDELYLAVFGPEGSGEEASIKVQLDQITQEVKGALGVDEETGKLLPVSSSINLALGELTLEATDKEGTTTLTLKGGKTILSSNTFDLHVKSANIYGKLTADQIETEDLKVDAANVTGTLKIGQLPDDVATTDNIPTEEEITVITESAISTTNVVARNLRVGAANISGTLSSENISLSGMFYISKEDVSGFGAGYIGINTSKGTIGVSDRTANVALLVNSTTAKLTYYDEKMIWVHSGGCYSSETIQVYSDRTLKNSISYDLGTEEKLFCLLRPCSFAYNSDKENKTHWGFVAQDVIESVEEIGMDAGSLALLGEYEGKYSIGYGELTALNTHMIQRLMERVYNLERAGK